METLGSVHFTLLLLQNTAEMSLYAPQTPEYSRMALSIFDRVL